MYRTNTDLEESILRIFFYEVQKEIQSLMVWRVAALGLSRSPGGPFFFSTVLSRLLGGFGVFFSEDSIICCSSFSISMNSSPKLLSYALRPLYYPLLFA